MNSLSEIEGKQTKTQDNGILNSAWSVLIGQSCVLIDAGTKSLSTNKNFMTPFDNGSETIIMVEKNRIPPN